MKLKPLGKITLLILALGLAFGGYRLWIRSQTTGGTDARNGVSRGASGEVPGGASGEISTAAKGNGGNDAPTSSSEIQIISSNTKKGWLADQIDAFNAKQGDGVRVVAKAVETREAMTGILSGQYKPALWSPSSVIWADRLAEVWEQKTGATLLDTGDANSYRQIFKSPIVFLTTKEKARFLRPLLEGGDAWSNIRKISASSIRAPYGAFKWAHADPLNANSGMLTMALILSDYAQRNGQSGAIAAVAKSPEFAAYLKELEKNFVYDSAVQKGSSALVNSFAQDPTRYDFITAYESAALDQVLKNPDLAVIYPGPTVNSEQAIAALNWPDLSAEQKKAARDFLEFVAQPQSIKAGYKEYFRPSRGDNPAISKYDDNGFRASYSAIEVPPYIALNDAGYQWSKIVAGK